MQNDIMDFQVVLESSKIVKNHEKITIVQGICSRTTEFINFIDKISAHF